MKTWSTLRCLRAAAAVAVLLSAACSPSPSRSRVVGSGTEASPRVAAVRAGGAGAAELVPAPPVPVAAEPVLAPAPVVRAPWQPPEVERRPFTRRVEHWRGLVHEIMAEEWEQGTLDGLAARLDDDLVLAVIQQESGGDPRALSWAGATGLMQVMPRTFALMMAGDEALAPAIDPDAFWDERSNVRAGIRYLALALQHTEGNLYWSLASYNAGIATVRRWRLAGLYAVPPIGGYTETADYAPAILRNYLRHRPGLELYIPDPMPPEHVPGAMQLLRESRREY